MLRAPSLGLALALSLAPLSAAAQTAPQPPPPPAALPPPPPPPTTTTLTPPPPPASTATVTTPGPTTLQAQWAEGPRRVRHRSLLRDRLRLLDTSIIPLAERSRDARRTEGIINLVIGAGVFGLGFAYSALSDTSGVSPTQALLWVQGGYTALTGAVQLLWVPARERLSEQYALQPRRTPHDRRLRVRFGEQALEDMASDGRRRRVLGALAGVGFSLASLGIIYRDQIFDGQAWPEPPAFNYLVIGLVGLSMVANLIPVFSASPEERLRDAYRREVRMLREAQDD